MVKNITLSAEEMLIQKARKKAVKEHRSLNAAFREWLARYVGQSSRGADYRALMEQLKHVRVGRKFSRDELNAR